MLASDKLFLLFSLNPLLSTINSMLTTEKLCFHISFTKLKLPLKQFTLIVVTQLERCELPPSKLTADLILSAIDDPHNILFIQSLLTFALQSVQLMQC
jgi:hypothetical protein